MLRHLRHDEEVVLYGFMADISEAEAHEAVGFLAAEYAGEALDYPGTAPTFEASASLWAAMLVYAAAQLVLYRQQEVAELRPLLAPYAGRKNAAAILSADLSLRFLPDIIAQLKKIDPEDALIEILENHLRDWHYSGVAYPLSAAALDFGPILENDCLLRLYLDRVITFRKIGLSRQPALRSGILSALGVFSAQIWNEFHHDQADPISTPASGN